MISSSTATSNNMSNPSIAILPTTTVLSNTILGSSNTTLNTGNSNTTSIPVADSTTAATGVGATGAGTSNNQSNPNNNKSTNMYSLKWNTQLLALQKALANLWESGIGTDAVLLCQGTPLPLHKIILTAASPYVANVVQTMSSSASHMLPIIVLDIPPEAGKALLSFLYNGEAHVPVSIIPSLVAGAKFLGISGFGETGVLESLTSLQQQQQQPESQQRQTCTSPTPSTCSSHNNNNEFKSVDQKLLHQHDHEISSKSNTPSPNYHRTKYERHTNIEPSRDHSPHNSYPPQSFLDSLKLTRVQQQHSPASSNTSGSSTFKINRNYTSNQQQKRYLQQTTTMATTSILDNLLKNPRNSQRVSNTPPPINYDTPVNLSCSSNALDYDDSNTSGTTGQLYYNSPNNPRDQSCYEDDHHHDDGAGDEDLDLDSDNESPIPAQLLEPNVEYHIGNEFKNDTTNTNTDRYGNNTTGRNTSHIGLPLSIQNPLIDLAKVASAMQSHALHQQQIREQQARSSDNHGNNNRSNESSSNIIHLPEIQQQIIRSEPYRESTRGIKRKNINRDQQSDNLNNNNLPIIKPVKIKKPQEAIICEICNKKFSNAYNLRVHMEGHSGQVFVCSVCSHASRSRDALRKHFAYRHRELWISGMSAFRSKSTTPGRKLSISKNNSNLKIEDNNTSEIIEQNNNNLLDSNGNLNLINLNSGGSDGTLTISEAN